MPESIAAKLGALAPYFTHWCLWHKGNKVPINPHSGGAAKSNDPSTFSTFENAQRACAQHGSDGLGVLMTHGARAICIDIDKCLDEEGQPNALAAGVLSRFSGYVEVSQSRRGLHFFLEAVAPSPLRQKITIDGCSVEVYPPGAKRYIAVTGGVYSERSRVQNEQQAFDRFIHDYGFKRNAGNSECSITAPDTGIDTGTDTGKVTDAARLSTKEIIDRIVNEKKRSDKPVNWQAVIDGSDDFHEGDASAADYALLCKIAFYSTDIDQTISVFEKTARGRREKVRQRPGYLRDSAEKAFAACGGKFAARPVSGSVAKHIEALEGGTHGLSVTKRGELKSDVHNVIEILRRDRRTKGLFRHNIFLNRTEITRPASVVFGDSASDEIGQFQECDEIAVRKWLISHYRIDLFKADLSDCIAAVARSDSYNPLEENLQAARAVWDGGNRLDTWLATYLGVDVREAPEYFQEIGKRFLISAVARALSPGCKADCMLVLFGKQGAGKSQSVKTLADAIYPKSFRENLPVLGDKNEITRALSGTWIAELAELTSIRGRDAQTVKAFLSTCEDTAREPYARTYTTRPRQCVFVGTTNEDQWLTDSSGGRRFWPVDVGTIDLTALKRDARQLWGEAVARFEAGEHWHLSDDVALAQAGQQQAARAITEEWDVLLHDAVRKAAGKPAGLSAWLPAFHWYAEATSDTDVNAFAKDRSLQMRFADALKRVGFEKKQMKQGSRWRLSDSQTTQLLREAREVEEAARQKAELMVAA